MPTAVSIPTSSRCDAAEVLTGSAELSDDPDPPPGKPRKPRKPRKFGKRGAVAKGNPVKMTRCSPDLPLSIHLNIQTEGVDPPFADWLESQLRRVAEAAGVEVGCINVMMVDDAAMTQLHEQYTDAAGTTDVLSFDLREDEAEVLEADIVVCFDVAVRQAKARGHEVRLEVLLYCVHGLLHLLGEDDHDAAGYDRMHRREDELLASIGLGPVFSRSTKTR